MSDPVAPFARGRDPARRPGTYLGCAACGRLLNIEWATRSIVCSCGARIRSRRRPRDGSRLPREPTGRDRLPLDGARRSRPAAPGRARPAPPRSAARAGLAAAARRRGSARAGLARRRCCLRPAGALDRDPDRARCWPRSLAVLARRLPGVARWLGARARVRAACWRWAAAVLVVAAHARRSSRWASRPDRPYGQDGGVVQLPLAIDRSCSRARARTARTTRTACWAGRRACPTFWRDYGGNPHPRATTPTCRARTSLMMPFYLLARAAASACSTRAS